jgi:hypothetical protein
MSSAHAGWKLDPALVQAVGQVASALNPQAKAVVDQANAIQDAKAKENFLVTKAKTFMGEKNYESAMQVAQYVLTNVNSKSPDAKKIVEDAKAAIVAYAKSKTAGTQADKTAQDATAVTTGVKNILGTFGK